MHLKNVFADRELEGEATSKDFLVVQAEASRRVRRQIKHYNLDATRGRAIGENCGPQKERQN